MRRKTLTADERRIKKDAAKNDEYLGEVEDVCLCWRYDGVWHRVTDFAGRFVNVWFRDGQLMYAQNVEAGGDGKVRRFARIRALAAPQQVTHEAELPLEISSFRVGSSGMLAAGQTQSADPWVRPWDGEWHALPDVDAPRDWGIAGCADHGWWVSWGDRLRHWHEGRWRSVTARGAQARAPWVSISTNGSRAAAVQGGELWVGDLETWKPVPLVPAPQMLWFEGDDLRVEDKASGLHRFAGPGHEPGTVLPMPAVDTKGTRAQMAARGTPPIARFKDRVWTFVGDDWVEVPQVPLWEAVGTEALRWETHREESWLPVKRKPRLPSKRAPKPDTPREVLDKVLRGSAPLDALTAEVACGPDIAISAGFQSKYTPLGYAAWAADNPRVLARLVSLGADVDGVSAEGNPPLIAAMKKDRAKNIAWLLKKGASPSLPSRLEVAGNDVDVDSPLAYAAYAGKQAAVEAMLATQPALTGTFNGRTALAAALFAGHEALVEQLRERGAPITTESPGAHSPLRDFFKDRPDLIDTYLEELRGDFAGEGGGEALIEMLVHQSLGHDKQELIDRLLDHGARSTKPRALRLAVETGQRRALEACLKAGVESGVGHALALAMRQDPIDPEIVRLLVGHGADPDEGDTGALLAAVAADDVAAARVLVEGGADPAKLHYDPKNMRADPMTAHAHAVRLEATETAAYLASLTG
ncbi:MAG: ankyrin repeat domain-containing protein [Myxococcota bacterium]